MPLGRESKAEANLRVWEQQTSPQKAILCSLEGTPLERPVLGWVESKPGLSWEDIASISSCGPDPGQRSQNPRQPQPFWSPARRGVVRGLASVLGPSTSLGAVGGLSWVCAPSPDTVRSVPACIWEGDLTCPFVGGAPEPPVLDVSTERFLQGDHPGSGTESDRDRHAGWSQEGRRAGGLAGGPGGTSLQPRLRPPALPLVVPSSGFGPFLPWVRTAPPSVCWPGG